MKKSEQSTQEPQHNIKQSICIIKIPEDRENKAGKKLTEIMVEKLPKLMTDIKLQIQEVQ